MVQKDVKNLQNEQKKIFPGLKFVQLHLNRMVKAAPKAIVETLLWLQSGT